MFEPSPEFLRRLNDIEEKSGRAFEAKVRHVRTPEGVAKYHEPIGSEIMLHPRVHLSVDTPAGDLKVGHHIAADSSIHHVDDVKRAGEDVTLKTTDTMTGTSTERHVKKHTVMKRMVMGLAALAVAAGFIGHAQQGHHDAPKPNVTVSAPAPHVAAPHVEHVPAPTTAAGYAKMWDKVDPHEWGGADVSISVPLKDGRSVWLYGDTLSTGNGFVHSTAIVQDGGNLHVSNHGQQLLPNDDPHHIYWIESAKPVGSNELHVNAAPMTIGMKSVWDFKRSNPKSRVALVKVDPLGNVHFEKWVGWDKAAPSTNDFKVIGPHHFTYSERAHPEAKLADGNLLMSKAQNWDDPSGFRKNADGSIKFSDYRPIFYEVPKTQTKSEACPCGCCAEGGCHCDEFPDTMRCHCDMCLTHLHSIGLEAKGAFQITIETKERHVRTEAGVEKYGEPIGSPIVAHPRRHHAHDAIKPRRPKASEVGWQEGTTTDSGVTRAVYREPTGHVTTTLDSHVSGVHKITVHDNVLGRDLEPSITRTWTTSSPDHVQEQVYQHAQRLTDDYLKRKRPALSKEEGGFFWDHSDGTYGVDWTYGDEPKDAPKWNADDVEARKWWAYEDSKSLSIVVSPSQWDGREYQIDPNAHETVNATMHTYDELWPGFSDLVPLFFVAPQASSGPGSTFMAYNRPVRPQYAKERLGYSIAMPEQYQIADDHVRTISYDHTIIGLAHEWFGLNAPQDIYKRHTIAADDTKSNWHAVNAEAIVKETGLQPWEVSMYTTLNHELGHTVGRLGTGELGAEGMEYNRDSYQYTFMTDLTEILKKYGVMDVGVDLWEHLDTSAGHASDKSRATMIFNQSRLQNELSKYGTSSIHEMLAECWASYMMDRTPTAFVMEVGKLMDDNLVQYLADFHAALEKAQKVTT